MVSGAGADRVAPGHSEWPRGQHWTNAARHMSFNTSPAPQLYEIPYIQRQIDAPSTARDLKGNVNWQWAIMGKRTTAAAQSLYHGID